MNFSFIRFFVVLIIACNSSFLISQNINFELVYGTQSQDDARSIIQTLDSGYAVLGSTSGFGSGQSDIYLTKISKTGNVTWQQAIGGTGIDRGRSIIQTADSGYAIAGYTNGSGNGGYDVYLVKTDKSGSTEWSKTYGGSDWDFGNSLIQTINGSYVICGSTYSYGHGGQDVYLIKTDSSGNQLWDSAYGGSAEDVGNSVSSSTDSGYFITGYTKSFGQGNEDVYLLKTDSVGNLKWTKTYGGTAEDIGSEGKLTTDGGFIIAGYTKSYGLPQYYKNWFIKTDPSGDTLWSRRDISSFNRIVVSVCQTFDGGYIFTGHDDNAGQYNMFLHKIDAGGWYQDYKNYGGLENENAFSVKQTFDSGYAVVGVTESYGEGVPNIYVLKTGKNLISTGTVVIVVGIEENESVFKKNPLFPNPASDYFTINADMNSLLEIFDSMGKRISTTSIPRGNNTIDISYFPDGIYFVRIGNDRYSASEKIIVRH